MGCPEFAELERHLTGGLDADASQRIARHVTGCRSCERLLGEVSENLADLDGLKDALRSDDADAPSHGLPERIGPFSIVREIGRGGMGVVYLGEQERPRRSVAVKVLRPGAASPQTLRRFELEADVLARLHHPGIATVYQAGVTTVETGAATDTAPYIAMEFVRGVRLDRFLKERAPSRRDRLELLVKIADALHHAHVKGLVHRDLKPGNILVEAPPEGETGAGTPKILDFGVARIADRDPDESLRTTTGQILGTVPYMSPEQITEDPGTVDARSDVYTLGVIAFEMFAGEHPYPAATRSMVEAARVIREDEPRLLGRIDPELRGDVEAIVAKALEKDPDRRYQSASELAADIRRHLTHQTVVARRPSLADQTRKMILRHKAPSVLIALVLLLVVGYAVTAGVLLERARRSESRASREATTAREVSDFLKTLFMATDPLVAQGEIPSVLDLVDAGVARIDDELADQPEVRASLKLTLGEVYASLGRGDEARRLLEEALAEARRLHGPESVEVAIALYQMADLKSEAGAYETAASYYREALRIYRRVHGENHNNVAAALSSLGVVYRKARALSQADSLQAAAAIIAERVHGPDHPLVASILSSQAGIQKDLGNYAEAEALWGRCLEIRRAHLGETHTHTLSTLSNLSVLYSISGNLASAEDALRQLLDISRRVYGEDHSEVAVGYGNLATIVRRSGRHTEAIELYRQAQAIHLRILRGDHPDLATNLNNLGNAFKYRGQSDPLAHHADFDSAEVQLRKSADMWRRLVGDDHYDLAHPLNNLGTLYQEMDRHREAIQLLEQALALVQKTFGREHVLMGKSLNNLGKSHAALGQYAEADSLLGEAIAMRRRLFGDQHLEVATSLHSIGELRLRQGRPGEAREHLELALAIRRRDLGEEHPLSQETAALLAQVP